ncbi:MAG: C/D box methylation guide ribonucleoprotein complex aNOP56 subunit, partial [Candidatus Aenigmarchaeota archaeon]|nr:C/D box methylation guide ribonucleoprotein complex aNOP56 subunit [Candidatus Aenigmarchaeota archaeon]
RKEGKKFEKNSLAEKFLKENLRDIAIKEKFFKNAEEFNEFIVRVSIEISKEKIRKSVGKDVFVMQTVRAIEELDKMINVFVERLREWYGLHFPELERGIENHKNLVEIVSKYGRRENIREWERLAKDSIGVKISKEDEEILKKYASYILNLFSLKESLERYLENLLKDVAPNLQAVAGTTLAARLINKAGSLEKLAKMASSTIQLIGAEKALFRYLKGKGKSPKHGIIFTHPYVMKAPRKLRGKIARALASKLSIAAKMDFYTKEFRGDMLKKELEKKVREILEKGK